MQLTRLNIYIYISNYQKNISSALILGRPSALVASPGSVISLNCEYSSWEEGARCGFRKIERHFSWEFDPLTNGGCRNGLHQGSNGSWGSGASIIDCNPGRSKQISSVNNW